MMEFRSLNGYFVKDEKARKLFEDGYLANYTKDRYMTKSNYQGRYVIELCNNLGSVKTLQGSAFNKDTNEYVIGVISSDNTECVLVIMDIDTNTINNRMLFTDGVLGHCNDIEYYDGKYYILTGSQNANHYNKCAVVNAETLEYIEEIDLLPESPSGANACAWCISYDYESDHFYVASYYKIYTYDSNFTLIKEVDYSPRNDLNFSPMTVPMVQCATAYKGNILININIYGNGEAYTWGLAEYDVNTGKLINFTPFIGSWMKDEIEGVFMVDDLIYLIGGQEYYTMTRLIPPKYLSDSAVDYFNTGIELAEGTDLNDILTPGKYCSRNAERSQTLLHTPGVNGSFTMNVFNVGYDSICQYVVYNVFGFGVGIYARTFNTVQNAWNFWRNLSNNYSKGVIDTITFTNAIFPGYATVSSKNIAFSIPLSRELNSNIVIDDILLSGNVTIFGVDGKVADNVDLSTLNIVKSISSLNMLRITLKQTSDEAWNVTNNTSLTVLGNFNLEIK